MRIGRLLVSLVFVSGAILLPSGGSPSAGAVVCPGHGATFEPADGQMLLIIGQHRDPMDAYVTGTGVVPGGFMVYSSVGSPVTGLHEPAWWNGWHHGQYEVDTYPNSTIQAGLNINPLEVMNAGGYDAGIAVLADWLNAVNRPVFVRLGYEFDGRHNAFDPTQYVAAWRRVVDGLRQRGVTNAAYVWHSVAAPRYNNHPLSAWYPGDSYVDWVGVSIFGQAFNNGAGLTYAHEMADFADVHDKPLMIAESTPKGARTPTADAEQLWAAWYAPVLNFINSRGVKAWSYINENWEEWGGYAGWGDSRVEANPALQSRWLATITQPNYLNASPALFCELGWPG